MLASSYEYVFQLAEVPSAVVDEQAPSTPAATSNEASVAPIHLMFIEPPPIRIGEDLQGHIPLCHMCGDAKGLADPWIVKISGGSDPEL
jgi:hypothetical protein